MKKTFLVVLLGILLFACSKENETKQTIKVERDPITQLYKFDLTQLTPPPTNTNFELKIFSKSGSPVFSISFTGTSYSWDGKTSDGNAVADGMYTYVLKNQDKSVNQDGFFYILNKK